MNLFQLVFKQMRQRALSTWLTLLSVFLGVGLAIAIMVVRRESAALFAHSDFGYELILGPPKGSPLQLTLNTVYHMDVSPGNVPYRVWKEMASKGPPQPGKPDYRPSIRWAIPIMVGDTWQGRGDRRIIGTTPQLFGYRDDGTKVPDNDESHPFEVRPGNPLRIADGTIFHPRKFEAVVGADLGAKDGFHVYDPKLTEAQNEQRHAVFQATHGMPGPNETPDIHKPKWHVVGILAPTHTADDRALYVPVISLYAIEEHELGMIKQALMRKGYRPFIRGMEAEAALRDCGYDPDTMSAEARHEFKLPPKNAGLTAPAPAPASKPASGELLQEKPSGGELMKEAPKPAATTGASTAPAAGAKAAEDDDPDAYTLDANGDIVPELPEAAWEISAILVKARSLPVATTLYEQLRMADPEVTAVLPAQQMIGFFTTFFEPVTLVLMAVSMLVTIVAAVSILVSIYNSVSARMREVAILRALGATRRRILTLICAEAGLVGLLGGIIGLVLGHGLGWIASIIAERQLGQGLNWWRIGWRLRDPLYNEVLYLVLVVVISLLAGLVPALKAYRTPVANNLVTG